MGKALMSENIQIRDAGLHASEFWGGHRIRQILLSRVKNEPLQRF